MAHLLASWSKDPSTQVGAVIVDANQRVLSLGWNGFPRGVIDDITERNLRPGKYDFYSHAEENAICNAAALGCSVRGGTIYVTHHPCAGCTRMIIQAGISEVVLSKDTARLGTHDSRTHGNEAAETMLREAGVRLREVEF